MSASTWQVSGEGEGEGKGKGEGQGEGEGKGSPPFFVGPLPISPLYLPISPATFLLVRSMHSGMHTREMRPKSACEVELGLG